MRPLAIVLQGLNAGLAAGHVAQLRPRRRLTGDQWTRAHDAYTDYGRLAAVLAPSATLAAATTAWRDWRSGRAPVSALSAAAAIASTVVIWRAGNEPVNRRIGLWRAAGAPEGWERLRDRWEFSHLASAVVHLVALGALAATPVPAKSVDSPVGGDLTVAG